MNQYGNLLRNLAICRKKTILVFIGISFLRSIYPVTFHAESCSQADVQAAINLASDGDTVLVPRGTCEYVSGTANAPSVTIDKAIILLGAGIDRTVIVDMTGKLNNQDPVYLSVSGIRLSGIAFRGMIKRNAAEPAIKVGRKEQFHIENCKFIANSSNPGRGIVTYARTGLINNCEFINCKQGIAIFGTGDEAWTSGLNLGSSEFVFVEDCAFNYDSPQDGAVDAYNGAKYIFRNNTCRNTHTGHHGRDSGSYRSTHSFEIYDNVFQSSLSTGQRAFHFRGGTGVVYNNVFSGNYDGFDITNYRSCSSFPPCESCDGTSSCDGNTESNGYPCQDQIGRTGDGMDAGGLQDLEPLYEWNNSRNGRNLNISIVDPCGRVVDHIQPNRDFYPDTMRPDYQPFRYPHPLRSAGPAVDFHIID